MNNVDKTYLSLLKDIIENGVEKETRAGRVKSVFGRQLRFDLKEGIPLLTTKKIFTKGVLYELLWFLNGYTNIKYLVDNNVHIWDDDAYRYYLELSKNNNIQMSKEEFLQAVKEERTYAFNTEKAGFLKYYKAGDLGPVYGKQWRSFGTSGKDQIQGIIDTLKTNPNDRRILCVAYNPDQVDKMALPPCHVMFQFYARELTHKERMKIFNERYMNGQIPKKWRDWFKEYSRNTKEDEDVEMPNDGSDYDIADIPKYGLSCMWTQRSVDAPLGLCWNISSYGLLTYIIAKLVNMVPDELIGSLGDCHIYLNQMEGVQEHLKRNGYDELPKLVIEGVQNCVEDFKYEDFKIIGYKCNPPIKMPLSVG